MMKPMMLMLVEFDEGSVERMVFWVFLVPV